MLSASLNKTFPSSNTTGPHPHYLPLLVSKLFNDILKSFIAGESRAKKRSVSLPSTMVKPSFPLPASPPSATVSSKPQAEGDVGVVFLVSDC